MKIDINKKQNLEATAKKKSKRSMMLKMVMPLLSQENGDQLSQAIESGSPEKVRKVMDKISKQLAKKVQDSRK